MATPKKRSTSSAPWQSFSSAQTPKAKKPPSLTSLFTVLRESSSRVRFSPKFFFLKDRISTDIDLHYENWVGNFFGAGNNPDIDDYRKFDRQTFYVKTLTKTNFGTKQWIPDFKLRSFSLKETTRVLISATTITTATSRSPKTQTAGETASAIIFRSTPVTIPTGQDTATWSNGAITSTTKGMGDYSYTHQELDVRGYTEFIWNTSMAVGLLWQRVDGNAPFDKLAGSDGLKRFRGVERNYFYGEQALFLQVEFRKKLFWRLAGDIFFEGGKTGDYFSDLMRNKWHRSLGFGGRFALNKKENLYARCELSWVDFKNVGMTMYVRDAF